MPRIDKVFTHEITPARFVNACDGAELMELEVLLSSPQYQHKIRQHRKAMELEAG